MQLALGHHLNALGVEDDHLEDVEGHHFEGHEVPDLESITYGEGGAPIINCEPVVDHPDRDFLGATGVRHKHDL